MEESVALATETAQRWILTPETLLRGNLALLFGLGSLSFIEPSPYEFFFFLLIPVALISGLTITRAIVALFLIVFFVVAAELTALSPYIEHRAIEGLTPLIYSAYTVYLYPSGLLFAMIFSRHTISRLTLCLNAHAFSSVFAATWGILSWLNVAGIGEHERIIGRIAGPFKDPNVLGTYCVFGALYLMHAAMLGGPRFRLLKLAGLVVTLFGGVFLSFSRGSWGAMIVSTLLMGLSAYVTADNRETRRTILRSAAGLVFLVLAGIAVIASNETLSSTVTDRAKLEQDYDAGTTGRFGNQMRSIPMLLDRPLGFGPYRFPVYFDLQPHNSYIGAFSSGGWVGGCAFLVLVLTTSFLALRLAFTRSPFLWHAQVVTPALMSLFLQAFQIDIDHWRFLFLMLGAVWGMESARMRLVPVRSQPERARAAANSLA
jgi:hypothetical protein